MNKDWIIAKVAAEVAWRWLDSDKDTELGRQAWNDLQHYSLLGSQFRRASVPYIFRDMVFQANGREKPWLRGQGRLSVLDMVKASWWIHVRNFVLRCDPLQFADNEPSSNSLLSGCLGDPEIGMIFHFLRAAPTLESVEIDLSQFDETGQKPVPWEYFSNDNTLAFEAFMKEWQNSARAPILVVRFIKGLPFKSIHSLSSLYLDSSSLSGDLEGQNHPAPIKGLKLDRSPEALEFYSEPSVYSRSLTELGVTIASKSEFQLVYRLLCRVSPTIQNITLSFLHSPSHQTLSPMTDKEYPEITFPALHRLLLEFKTKGLSTHAYPVLNKLKSNANNLRELRLVAHGKYYDALISYSNAAANKAKREWSFFEALHRRPFIFPSLRKVSLELAKHITQVNGSEHFQPVGIGLRQAQLRNAGRNTAITFICYLYE